MPGNPLPLVATANGMVSQSITVTRSSWTLAGSTEDRMLTGLSSSLLSRILNLRSCDERRDVVTSCASCSLNSEMSKLAPNSKAHLSETVVIIAQMLHLNNTPTVLTQTHWKIITMNIIVSDYANLSSPSLSVWSHPLSCAAPYPWSPASCWSLSG
jgi:hypothetical protein